MEEDRILFSACDEKWIQLQDRAIAITGGPIEDVDVTDEKFFALQSVLTDEERSALREYKNHLLFDENGKFIESDRHDYLYSFKVTIYDPLAHRFVTLQVDAVNAGVAKTAAMYQFHAQFPSATDRPAVIVKVE